MSDINSDEEAEDFIKEPFEDSSELFDLVCNIKDALKEYISRQSLPLCENLHYGNMHDFILYILEQ
jgi:hypothetical protein